MALSPLLIQHPLCFDHAVVALTNRSIGIELVYKKVVDGNIDLERSYRPPRESSRSEEYEKVILICMPLVWVYIGVLVISNWLPNKYYFDSKYLYYLSNNVVEPKIFGSFANLAWVTSVFTQAQVSIEVLELVFGALSLAIAAFVFCESRYNATLSSMAVSCFLMAVFYIYLSQLSKEFLVALSLSIFFVLKKNDRSFWAVLVLVCYAFFARRYWFIIIYIWFFLEVFDRLKINNYAKTMFLLLVLCTVFLGYRIGFDESILLVRDQVNSGRDSQNAVTMFNLGDIESGSALFYLDIIPYLKSFFWFLFPFWLLTMGAAKYVAGLIVQLVFVFVILKIMGRSRKVKNGHSSTSSVLNLVISSYAVFIMFEPDLGSFLKHQAPFVPLLLGVAYGRE